MIISGHLDGKIIRYKRTDYKPDVFTQAEDQIYRIILS